MKIFLITILSLSFTITAFAQQDSGFTNKAEAKNLMVNGLKEGKWVEYMKQSVIRDKFSQNTYAPFYRLTFYKAGMPLRVVRLYYESGKLKAEIHYNNGKLNGVRKEYYESGKLWQETPYTDGKMNGVVKIYDTNGMLSQETTYANNLKNGVQKKYYENGKLKEEDTYDNGKLNGVVKGYYENGNLKEEDMYTEGEVNGVGKTHDIRKDCFTISPIHVSHLHGL